MIFQQQCLGMPSRQNFLWCGVFLLVAICCWRKVWIFLLQFIFCLYLSFPLYRLLSFIFCLYRVSWVLLFYKGFQYPDLNLVFAGTKFYFFFKSENISLENLYWLKFITFPAGPNSNLIEFSIFLGSLLKLSLLVQWIRPLRWFF